jgi:hypothetical protein
MKLGYLLLAVWLLGISSHAWAQLPDPVDPATVVDGPTLAASGGLLGEATAGSGQLTGEVAAVGEWTNAGIDRTEGLRGPRWTNRWGARLYALAAAGTGDRPLDIEERGEVAIYGGSLGQSVTWQSQPRLTDRFWYRATDRMTLGAFVDFCGLGLVKKDGDDELGAEGFPMFVALDHDASGGNATTISIDLAVARVAGRGGDVRIIDERVAVRQVGDARAVAIDASAFSIRRLDVAPHSPWSVSLDLLGVSALTGYEPARGDLLGGSNSIMPLVHAGIVHRGLPQLRAERSEIGRPVIDDADFGAEVGTLHRLVEGAGIDEGGQVLAWWRHALDGRGAVRAEAMFGLADRALVPAMAPAGELPAWVDGSGLVYLARGELEVSAQLAHDVTVQARGWIEHSERADPTQPARWSSGVQSGIAWQM